MSYMKELDERFRDTSLGYDRLQLRLLHLYTNTFEDESHRQWFLKQIVYVIELPDLKPERLPR